LKAAVLLTPLVEAVLAHAMRAAQFSHSGLASFGLLQQADDPFFVPLTGLHLVFLDRRF
jgi:hypothetical protein